MKKSCAITLGAIGFVADIITLTSAFKFGLTNWLCIQGNHFSFFCN